MARKILLADDSVTAQNMGRKILADAGYEVITVNNGSAALKKIAETRPDLIVLDVYMPGYSGLEVCQRLKETQESARIPVLLTVGKLEPFKPEEAKRARADAFIVKPFEASELLSALTKLEGRIVPRTETSKPGRFARSIASIEEGRHERSAARDEDSGWKNRIGFPLEKKSEESEEKEKEKEEEREPAIFNTINRDLRTAVEGGTPGNAPEDGRVDVSTLAPVGLPNDVTPEEIAALAAAAAQVQAVTKKDTVTPEAPPKAESRKEVGIVDIWAAPVASAAPVELTEQKPEANLADEDAPAGGSTAAVAETVEQVADQIADHPVTMAVAAGAESAATASRWTAVAVALTPEDAPVSLEGEMRAACAAFAAAESVHAAIAAGAPSAVERNRQESESILASVPVAVPAPDETPAPLPEVAHTLEAEAGVATVAISTAIEELEAKAAAYGAQGIASAPGAAEESAPSTMPDVAAIASEEFAERATNQADPPSDLKKEDKNEDAVTENLIAACEPHPGNAETSAVTPLAEVSQGVARSPVAEEATPAETVPELSEDTAAGETAAKESDIAATTAAAWANWRRVRESDDPKATTVSAAGPDEPLDAVAMAVAAGAEKAPEESAAAVESNPLRAKSSQPESSQSESSQSDPEIASIVDSVLADLRPKIVEEISRKLGKKK